MKVMVTATSGGLDAEVDPRFGRCAHFVFVDTETMDTEAVQNENTTAGGGAGVQSAQLVSDKGAEVVLTGNCGPNAYRTLQAAGIDVIVGVSGTVREAVDKFKAGGFKGIDAPNVNAKFGTSP
jgi:predicted Fe-Mo cluster-binding NifX family protein